MSLPNIATITPTELNAHISSAQVDPFSPFYLIVRPDGGVKAIPLSEKPLDSAFMSGIVQLCCYVGSSSTFPFGDEEIAPYLDELRRAYSAGEVGLTD